MSHVHDSAAIEPTAPLPSKVSARGRSPQTQKATDDFQFLQQHTEVVHHVTVPDGSCSGNPGPGGWAYILRFGAVKKERVGCDPQTTNSRMELMAAIQGLLAFKEPCEVEITTDAEYVKQGITQWVIRWKHRHWWKKNHPVRNDDLWMELGWGPQSELDLGRTILGQIQGLQRNQCLDP
jgi:ribonuclease HI